MKCPKDNSNLKIQESEKVVGHVCDQCSGIYLKESAVSAFKYNYETSILEKIASFYSGNDSFIGCPGCGSIMKMASTEGIEIDYCENCKGIWFDKDEVTKLISLYKPKISEESKVLTGYFAVDIIANILFGLN